MAEGFSTENVGAVMPQSGNDTGSTGAPSSTPATWSPAAPAGHASGAEPAPLGDFGDYNLLKISQSIFGAEHEDDPKMPGQEPQQQEQAQQPPQAPPVNPEMQERITGLETDLKGWTELGKLEQVQQDVRLVDSLFSETPVNFWAQLHGNNPEMVINVLDAAIEAWPNFFLDALAMRGHIDMGDLQYIPEQHRQLYQTLPMSIREELLQLDDETLNWRMDQYAKAAERDRGLEQQQQQEKARAEQARQEKAVQLRDHVRESVRVSALNSLGADLQVTGDAKVDSEISDMLWSYFEEKVCTAPQSERRLKELYQAMDRGDKKTAMRLSGTFASRINQAIKGFLGRLGAVTQVAAAAPAPAGAQPLPADQMPANAGSFSDENLTRLSREIFG
jgi:hypothetical protein